MSHTIPRKRMLHAHGKHVVFVKGNLESAEHVLMKAFIWALYLPQYPALTVEIFIGDKYKPDVVMMDAEGRPIFWGESGQVAEKKIESLGRRYRDTHFVIAKWNQNLVPLIAQVQNALTGLQRSAPIDLVRIPDNAPERFIDADGNVTIMHADVEWARIGDAAKRFNVKL